jgi:hypothetical protein
MIAGIFRVSGCLCPFFWFLPSSIYEPASAPLVSGLGGPCVTEDAVVVNLRWLEWMHRGSVRFPVQRTPRKDECNTSGTRTTLSLKTTIDRRLPPLLCVYNVLWASEGVLAGEATS